MKRTFLAFSLALTAFTATAQSGYDFSYKTGQPYTPLSSGMVISPDSIWDEENWVVDLPFKLDIGGIVIDKFYNTGNGFMPVTDTDGTVNGFMPLGAVDLADRGLGGTSARSPIRYTIDGTAPSRIFKLEYWNAGFWDNIATTGIMTDSVNFQVWAYEGSGTIEFHYGDSYIADPSMVFFLGDGPLTGYATQYDEELEKIENLYMLTGSPAAPVMDSTYDPSKAITLDAMPAKGTVYSFTPAKAGTRNGEQALTRQFSLYPTRATQTIYLDNNASLKGELVVYNMNGQVAGSSMMQPGRNEISIQQLPPAMYLLKVQTTAGAAAYRFIKE